MKHKSRMMNNCRKFLFFTLVFSGLFSTNAVSLQNIEPKFNVLPTITSISSLSSAFTTTRTSSTGTPPSTQHSTSTTPSTTMETTTEITSTSSVSSTTETPTTTSVSSTTGTSTTTAKPSPPSSPGIWMVTDGNTTCILAKLTASFVVPYVTSDKKYVNSSLFFLPGNATANGTCKGDGNTQEIALSWATEQSMNYNSLVIVFKSRASNISEDNFFVSEITLGIHTDPKNFPNATSNYLQGQVKGAEFYQTKVNTSYRCSSESLIHIPIDDYSYENTTALISVKHFQLEAFRTQHGEQFSTAMDCPSDGMLTSDVVPIAVGCALAALVVVVLIAYLIGRRRARQRGYQSV